METRRTTVSQAFPERIQYVVPSYQRNYVWSKEDQWEPLWDDVLEVTRRILDNDSNQEPHFLGTIITKPISSGQSRLQLLSVVDGQQRLTTLQLLIAAAHRAFSQLELTDFASMLEGYVFNQQASVQKIQEKYKILHKSRDYLGFSNLIDLGLGESNVLSGDPKAYQQLNNCYEYFKKMVCSWLQDDLEECLSNRADALRTAILDKLQVVEITLDRENSHAIFEALNARGEPLTEWEKTKNYILSISVNDDDPDGDYTYTNFLDVYDSDAYWSQRVSLPRFSGKRMDLFLFFSPRLSSPSENERHQERLDCNLFSVTVFIVSLDT